MLEIGDYVVHNTFPPIEGYVVRIEKAVIGQSSVAVQYREDKLFYDDENTWDVIQNLNNFSDDNDDSIIDVDAVEL